MRRKIALSAVVGALMALGGAALADPSFGPGNSGGNGNQMCHPPGQTNDLPQCK
jgi:hypothetical protein